MDVVFLTVLAALVAWIGLSIAWSANPASTVLELERGFVPLAGCAAFVAIARRDAVHRLALALMTAITLISVYALATRLFPERLGSFDPVAVYRLSDPIGYWNGLGVFAVMGIVLAAGVVAADGYGRVARAGAGGALVVLAVTVFYTYSRASWIALLVGAAAAVALSPKRLRLIATTALLIPGPAVAVFAASRAHALTHLNAPLAEASHDGHRLAPLVVLIAVATAATTLVLPLLTTRVDLSESQRFVAGSALAALGVAALIGVVVHAGGPVRFVERAHDAFVAQPTEGADLNARLRSFSGNGRAETWRYALDTYERHPLLGTGAGTFERFWQKNAASNFKVRDAHELYLETLMELGPVGFALLVALLLVPVAAAIVARRHPIVPAALGAYVAFLVHAGTDWDWELAGVTLTALFIGLLAVVAARTGRPRPVVTGVRATGVAAVVAAAAFATLGLLGNSALAKAQDDTDTGQVDAALTQAARARRWMPWSPQPWIAQAEAQIAGGDRQGARRSLVKAISVDDREWQAWLELAVASNGSARARALAHARRLYPASIEIREATPQLTRSSSSTTGG